MTKEAQYGDLFDYPKSKLGVMASQVWRDDPKRLVFLLARYKFVAKMLAQKKQVLEVGCADAFGSRVVAAEVEELTVSDFDPVFVNEVRKNADDEWQKRAMVHDIVESASSQVFDAAYCLDVFEHIEPQFEEKVIRNLYNSVSEDGVVIIGIPSLESQKYASEYSKKGHVNCKSGAEFKNLLSSHFKHVFLFSMNDEVVHTGFYPMAHYLLAICAK